MLNPFETPMTTKLHASLHAQAEKALSLSRHALDFQMDQMQRVDQLAREQAVASTRAAMEAWQAGAKMVMDAHAQAVADMAPAARPADA